MESKPTIVLAAQDATETFSKEVDRLLEVIGHPEALVTDESWVSDFLSFGPAGDPEVDLHNETILSDLSGLMGRKVKRNECLWRLAQELRARSVPPTVH